MNRSRSILGLMFLSAVCFAAFGASSASASTLHQCENTGGNESGTGTRYSDANCTTVSGTGSFETVPLTAGPHAVTATNTSSFTLHGEAAGVAVNVVCESMMSGAGTTATNEEVEGEMTVHGEGTTEFGQTEEGGAAECEVTEPAGCTVKEPIVTATLTSHTEDGAEEKHYVMYEPKGGEGDERTFVELNFSGCNNKLVNGKKPVKGTARSESTSASTQSFTSESGSELTFAGHAATLTGSYHFTTPDGTALGLETP